MQSDSVWLILLCSFRRWFLLRISRNREVNSYFVHHCASTSCCPAGGLTTAGPTCDWLCRETISLLLTKTHTSLDVTGSLDHTCLWFNSRQLYFKKLERSWERFLLSNAFFSWHVDIYSKTALPCMTGEKRFGSISLKSSKFYHFLNWAYNPTNHLNARMTRTPKKDNTFEFQAIEDKPVQH